MRKKFNYLVCLLCGLYYARKLKKYQDWIDIKLSRTEIEVEVDLGCLMTFSILFHVNCSFGGFMVHVMHKGFPKSMLGLRLHASSLSGILRFVRENVPGLIEEILAHIDKKIKQWAEEEK